MRTNPSWSFWLWGENDTQQLIATYYPRYLTVYKGYVDPIKRMLAARYFYVHRYGGVYLDLDLACAQPLNLVARAGEAIFVPPAMGRLSETFIMAPPDHPVLAYMIHKLPGKAKKSRSRAAGAGFLDYILADLEGNSNNSPKRVTLHNSLFVKSRGPCSSNALCAENASGTEHCAVSGDAQYSPVLASCALSLHGLHATLSGFGVVEPSWNSTHICSSKGCFFLGRPEDAEPARQAAEGSGTFTLPQGNLSISRCPTAVVMAVSNRALPASNHLKRTAAALGVPLAVPYLPLGAQGLRRGVYARSLERMQLCADTVVLLVDGYDTFLRCNTSELVRRVRKFERGAVLVSAESQYKFQDGALKLEWDALAKRYAIGGMISEHRYVNGGGIGGRVSAVARFARAAASLEPPPFSSAFKLRYGGSDQNPTATTLLRDAREDLGLRARLDYESRIFHTGSFMSSVANAVSKIALADACIVHVPDSRGRKLLGKLVNRTGPPGVRGRIRDTSDWRGSVPSDDMLSKPTLSKPPTSPSGSVQDTLPPLGSQSADICVNASYVTLLTGARYAAAAACLPAQLRYVHAVCPIILVYDDNDVTLPLQLLEAAFGRTRLVPLSKLKGRYAQYGQGQQTAVPAGRRLFSSREVENTHQKLWLWALPVKKAVFIDIDTLLLGNVDSLLQVTPPSFKARKRDDHQLPSIGAVSCYGAIRKDAFFNTGVFVFTPSLEVLSHLLRVARFAAYPFRGHMPLGGSTWADLCSPADKPLAFLKMFPNASSAKAAFAACRARHSQPGEIMGFINKACETTFTDQSILNHVFGFRRARLPTSYNDYNRFQTGSARIIHFVGEPKPWDLGKAKGQKRRLVGGRLNSSRLWLQRCSWTNVATGVARRRTYTTGMANRL